MERTDAASRESGEWRQTRKRSERAGMSSHWCSSSRERLQMSRICWGSKPCMAEGWNAKGPAHGDGWCGGGGEGRRAPNCWKRVAEMERRNSHTMEATRTTCCGEEEVER